jgi:hypothetical protein
MAQSMPNRYAANRVGKGPAKRDDADVWPPERITLELSWHEAIVLRELLDRYQDSRKPELVTDAAEWRALVQLQGHLERGGAWEIPDYGRVLREAREALGIEDPWAPRY